MTDKELKHLNRGELLQMLIEQMDENKALQERLEQAESQLKDRRIMIEKAGTLAEASLALNGVFQAAEEASRQYLENIQRMSSEQDAVCQAMERQAEEKAEKMIEEAQMYRQRAQEEADEYWRQVKARAEALLKEHDALRALIQSAGGN